MKRTILLAVSCIGVLTATAFMKTHRAPNPGAERPNVLYIFVDDLRPDLGCYGNREIHSPNMDAIARKGVVFTNQFVTVPTCGASRYSLLTGRLPRTAAHLGNDAFEKLMAPNARTREPESFVDAFRRNGYTTVGIGKISHSADGYVYGYNEPKSDSLEMPQSWDKFLFNPGKWKTGWNAFFAYADGESRISRKGRVKPYERGDVEDEGYPDGLTAELAMGQLEELAKGEGPFFLGVGFFKPHLPFNAPKKYWDLYDEGELSLTPSPDVPHNTNQASLHSSGEFNQYTLGEEKPSLDKPASDAYARKIRHSYYASISYVDALIGKVTDKLKQLGLDKNTIVVVWGDHGWHLGDDRVWGKHTIFERSLRSVLIVKAPHLPSGVRREQVISSVDIYPTLMDLCNLDKPAGLDGQSFLGLLQNHPVQKSEGLAFSYFKSGITVRNDRYRYTRYFRKEKPSIELYDHQSDPFENDNIAGANPTVTAAMDKLWIKGNTGIFSGAK